MKKSKKLILILLYIAALVICAIIIYIVPSVAGLLESTYIAEHGDIEVSQDVDAYVVRNETVYTAANATSVNRLVKAGDLVKAGTAVVELSGTGLDEQKQKYTNITTKLGDAAVPTENGVTGQAGYVSYNTDGAEGLLNNPNIDTLNRKQLGDGCDVAVVKTASGKCAKGDPVFKVTANGDWWLVFYVSKKEAKNYVQDNNVELTIGNETVKGYIAGITPVKKSDEVRIKVCCSVFVKDYLKSREMKVKVVTEKAEGLVIEKKSIIRRKGVQGVLVKNKNGDNVFTPICIYSDNGEQCIVAEDIFMDEGSNFVETISVYDEIIKSPHVKKAKKK